MIKKFVITGGPCAGKSTAISFIKKALEEAGARVIALPEVATIFIQAGLDPGLIYTNSDAYNALQLKICQTQQTLEKAAYNLLEHYRDSIPSVVLCDRGMVDNAAYLDAYGWNHISTTLLSNPRNALGQYDAVFHLVTAAKGAESFYRQTDVRKESIGIAKELDSKTLSAWINHPNLHIIPNPVNGTFDVKLQILKEHVLEELHRK